MSIWFRWGISMALFFLVLIPAIAFADGVTCDATQFCNPLLVGTLNEFLDLALNALIIILFPFVVLFFIYSGFQLVTAQGNPGEIAKARKGLMWCAIGALIILGARAISLAIQGTVNEIEGSVEAPHPYFSADGRDTRA